MLKYVYFCVIESTSTNTSEEKKYKKVILSTNREKREQAVTKIDFQFGSSINLNHIFYLLPLQTFCAIEWKMSKDVIVEMLSIL